MVVDRRSGRVGQAAVLEVLGNTLVISMYYCCPNITIARVGSSSVCINSTSTCSTRF